MDINLSRRVHNPTARPSKSYPYGRGKFRENPPSASSEPNVQSAPVSKNDDHVPNASSSQTTAGASNSLAAATPAKGVTPTAFPFQFGRIGPDILNKMQIPSQTSSALSNLDEVSDGLMSIQNSDTPKENNKDRDNRDEEPSLMVKPIDLAGKPAAYVAELLKEKRVEMKKALDSCKTLPEMKLVAQDYLRHVCLNLVLLKDKKDLKEELEVLKRLCKILIRDIWGAYIARTEADISCYRTAIEILTMNGLADLLDRDTWMMSDNLLLSKLRFPDEIKSYLADIEDEVRELEDCLLWAKSEMKRDQYLMGESQLEDQSGMEENQLKDQTEVKVNKLDNREDMKARVKVSKLDNIEDMKARVKSLNERLVSQTLEMERIPDYEGGFRLLQLAKSSVFVCENRVG